MLSFSIARGGRTDVVTFSKYEKNDNILDEKTVKMPEISSNVVIILKYQNFGNRISKICCQNPKNSQR